MSKTELLQLEQRFLELDGELFALRVRFEALAKRVADLKATYEAVAHARELLEKGIGE
jgi:hypothetical protein